MVVNQEPNAKFKLKETLGDCKKVLLRHLEANVHWLFSKQLSEMKKSQLLEYFERVNTQFSCNCPFEKQNELCDTVFHENELVEQDIEVILDKLRLKVDPGRVFCKQLVEHQLVDGFKRFFETKVLPMMKVNKCKLK